ncbi:hypothetical protein [Streptomyces sp. NPDC006739]|uniref:hypothetical protein n=1 Tax=Streptomyces sp. NPDC006739 TaxID=3364763 RepID=UPI0036C58D5D
MRRRRTTVITAALVVLGAAGAVASQLHVADAASTTLPGGQVLAAGESLLSADGDYELRMGTDGDLVENSLFGVSPIYQEVNDRYGNAYFGGGNAAGGILVGEHVEPIWSSGTGGHPGARAVMQNDGNLVVYAPDGHPLWASGTAGHPGARIVVQSDANAVVYGADHRALWSTGRVSTTDSGDSGPTNVRNCPTVGGGPRCGIRAYVPNGTGVTMKCWTTSEPPAYAHVPSDKWFYVQVHDPRGDYYGFVDAPYVAGQIATPRCVDPPGLGGSVPPAPTVSTGTTPPGSPPPPATTSAPPPPPSPTATAPTTSAAPSVSDPPVSRPPVSDPATRPPGGSGGRQEQSGSHGSPTFTDPYNASGEGPRVPAMSTVTVACRVYAPQIASANPDGWWYRIASSPWSGTYYAVANTFWNGDTPGKTPYTHNTDWSVPVC